eukprot:g43652.t1
MPSLLFGSCRMADYVALHPEPKVSSVLRGAVAGLAMVVAGAAGWATRGLMRAHDGRVQAQVLSTSSSSSASTLGKPYYPREGVDKVMVRYGPPSTLQLLPPGLFGKAKGPSALFLYSGDVPNELAQGSERAEGWVYGACLVESQGSSTAPWVAVPNGQPESVVKGQLLLFPANNFQSKLQAADQLQGYNPDMDRRLRRGVVAVVREDGTNTQAYMYFLTRSPDSAKADKAGSTMQVMWYGTNSWRWQMGGQTILVDPWLVGKLEFFQGASWFFSGSRTTYQPEWPKQDEIDLILLSQGLADHAHPDTLTLLAKSHPQVQVIGSPKAAALCTELGFQNVRAVSNGDFTSFRNLHIQVLEGALTGPVPENGYILSAEGGPSLYYEPHGAFPASLSQHGPVDVMVGPTMSLGIKALEFVYGATNGFKLIQQFRPKYYLSTAAGNDGVQMTGVLPKYLISAWGGRDELQGKVDAAGLKTKVLAPAAGEVLELAL